MSEAEQNIIAQLQKVYNESKNNEESTTAFVQHTKQDMFASYQDAEKILDGVRALLLHYKIKLDALYTAQQEIAKTQQQMTELQQQIASLQRGLQTETQMSNQTKVAVEQTINQLMLERNYLRQSMLEQQQDAAKLQATLSQCEKELFGKTTDDPKRDLRGDPETQKWRQEIGEKRPRTEYQTSGEMVAFHYHKPGRQRGVPCGQCITKSTLRKLQNKWNQLRKSKRLPPLWIPHVEFPFETVVIPGGWDIKNMTADPEHYRGERPDMLQLIGPCIPSEYAI